MCMPGTQPAASQELSRETAGGAGPLGQGQEGSRQELTVQGGLWGPAPSVIPVAIVIRLKCCLGIWGFPFPKESQYCPDQ